MDLDGSDVDFFGSYSYFVAFPCGLSFRWKCSTLLLFLSDLFVEDVEDADELQYL